MFNKKPISSEFVVLSNKKKVLFYELTRGILNKVTNKTTKNNLINTNEFIYLMETELTKLSQRELFNLPLKDGNIIRDKIREILKKNDLLTIEAEEKKPELFDKRDIEWFERNKASQLNGLRSNFTPRKR
jgi:hypothetical protein